MAYWYYVSLHIKVRNALGTEQQEKLRLAVLDAINDEKIPYSAVVVTADIGGEEKE